VVNDSILLIIFNKMFDSESSSDGGWISWFCDLEGHEFFVEVISDDLNSFRLMQNTFATRLIFTA
jgi:hypothetical protein